MYTYMLTHICLTSIRPSLSKQYTMHICTHTLVCNCVMCVCMETHMPSHIT